MSNLTIAYPELNSTTNNKVQATYSSILNKYRVTSEKEIEIKRGIEANGIVSAIGANSCPNKNAGWFKYYMTEKAFDIFCEKNQATLNIYFD
jgi:hypothetical protein